MKAQLSEFSSFVQGGRHKKSGKHFVEKGYPAYGAGGMNGFLADFEFEKPAIVLSSIGARCGKCFLPESSRWSSLANTQLIFPDERKADIRFIWYQLNDEESWIRRGTGQPYIRPSDVKEREVYFPALDEQRRIAAILDKAGAIRRKRQQALALADEFLKSVFLEMFGDPNRNPNYYPVKEFLELLTVPLRNGISPSSKGDVAASVLTLSAITGEQFDATQIKEGKFLQPISKTDQVNVEDFYICRGNGSPDLVGKGYFANQSMDGVAFPDTMIAAKINANEVNRGFLETLWNSQFVRGQILEAARTTNGTYKINQTSTGAIRIPTPPKPEQDRFQYVFRKIEAIRKKLEVEDNLFASLSQRAFRGEL